MSESFEQCRRYGSRWRLIEFAIGLLFLFGGIGLYVWTSGQTLLPLVLAAIGVFELFSGQIKKAFWLRRHMRSKLNGAEIALAFDEDGFDSEGPFSEGRMKWEGIERAVRTPKGILIWPQKGMYIYVPEAVAGSDTIQHIEQKVAGNRL